MRFPKTLFMILCFTLVTATAAAQGEVTGSIYQTTNVRRGPDTRFEIVGQLSAGDQVLVDGRDSESRWLHILLPTGEVGWLPVFALVLDGDLADIPVLEDDAESTPVPGAAVTVVSYGRVNVRSGPGTDYEIVGQLDVDDSAEALARSSTDNDWLLILLDETEGAPEGWVAYFTVNVQGDPGILPVLVPDSSGDTLIPPSRLIRARFNVRLHDAPQLTAPTLLVVPFGSEVTAIGRSAAGDWLFVGYGEDIGWGVAQLFEISRGDIEDLPVYEGAAVP
ncbi:MAG: SH3 domain-containing protein [Anaerolineae bacterium]|nr:SH3 domain-containing protein [Anaerolineae bacterium]